MNVVLMFDNRCVMGLDRYKNEEKPDGIPMRNQGEIPVIVRVVRTDGSEAWKPAEARRWTSTHVMVAFPRAGATSWQDLLGWFRAEDVVREIPGPLPVPQRSSADSDGSSAANESPRRQ